MPNQSTPTAAIPSHSRRVGARQERDTSSATPRATAPKTSRPSDSAPGENVPARCRMPTKAEAQSTSVTPTAASGSQAGTSGVSEGVGEGTCRA